MRVSRLKVSFIIFCLITLPTFVLAQKTWLEQYSIDKANQWQKNRLIAESIATKLNMPIRLEYEDGTTMELQRFENTRPVYYITDNIRSAKTISTNKVWPGGSTGYALTGSTETLGEWDGGGVRTTHQEFGGRVIQSQGTSNQHSTHVAGTIMAAGLDTNAKGMAYQALLKEYDWNNDESEMAAAANAGLRISNHSYGTINGWYFDYFNDAKWAWFGDTTISNDEDYSFGYYDADAQSWDNISYNAPYYLIVNSAGNDRGDGPGSSVQHWVNVNGNWSLVTRYRPYDGGPNGKYDCISGTSLAKNVLSVGSIKDLTSGYTTPPFVQMESYSGWGPTDDGRIKPDIVANGQSVYSASNSSNTVYANLSGTSMASPAVTGSIGLLLEQQRRMHGTTPLLSSTLKAIVINSADEAGPNPGPDYEYGWGLLNTPRSVQTMKLDSIDGYESHILERMLYEDSVITIQVASNGTSPLRATICWTDPSSSPLAPSLDNPITMLKNDIDLRITKNTSGSVSYPWILDGANPTTAATVGDNIRDNVEQIYIASPSKGLYTLTINHKGVLTNDSQRVSIVVTGNSHIGPFAYFQSDTVTVSILPNDSSIVTYRLYNNGDDTLEYSANVVTTSWLTLSNENNGIISDDSEFIQLNVNTMNLSQWSTYNSSFTITTNDPTQPTKNVYVVLTTLGPLISAPPSSIVIEAETTEVKFDTLTLSNNGYSDLNYLITSNSSLMKNNGATFPSWLTLSSDNGTLTPNESLDVILTFDATAQAIGNYSTTLSFSSNDSLTGTRTTTLDFHVATRRTLSFAVGTRWNIVSLPLTTFTFSKTALFPSASSEAFLYNAGYFSQTTLTTGEGYWLKFPVTEIFSFDGYLLLKDTIDVTSGWNIVGSLSYPVDVSTITSNPPGLVTSEFVGFENGYVSSDSIQPGKAYWVKVSGNGQLILSTNPLLNASNRIRIVPTSELPPTPPDVEPNTNNPTIPNEFVLEQNYPNPFNPTTNFGLRIADFGLVTLKVFNVLGVEVATVFNETMEPGVYNMRWDASTLPSGLYFYKLTAGSFTDVKKLVLMK